MIHSATGITFLYDGGITLRSGRRGFTVYRDGKVVAQYTAMGLKKLKFGDEILVFDVHRWRLFPV